MATNPTKGLLAFSGRSSCSPTVFVYQVPQDVDLASSPPTLLAALRAGPRLEHSCLAISRDGNFIAAVGSCLDFEVTVWKICTGSKVEFEEEGDCRLPGGCSSVSFNPLDGSHLCFSGDHGIAFWEVSEEYGRVSVKKVKAEEGEWSGGWRSHLWQLDGKVLCLNNGGDVVKFNAKDGKVLAVEGDSEVSDFFATAIVHIAEQVLVSCTDSSLRWLDAMTLKETFRQEFIPSSTTMIPRAPPVLCHATLSASCKYMLGRSNDGEIYVVSTAVGEAQEEERKAQMGEPIMSLHEGPVLGLAPVYQGNAHLVASVGVDGKLRVWDIEPDSVQRQYDLLCAGNLAEGLCCIDANPSSPFLAVGSSYGDLLLVGVTVESGEGGDSNSACSVWVAAAKRAFKEAVATVRFNPQATQLLVTCKLAQEALVYDVEQAELRLTRIISLQQAATAGCWLDAETAGFACGSLLCSAKVNGPAFSSAEKLPCEVKTVQNCEEAKEGEGSFLGMCGVEPKSQSFVGFSAKKKELVFANGEVLEFDKGITHASYHGKGILAVGGISGGIQLLQVESGRPKTSRTLSINSVLQSAVTSICFIPKGNMLVVSDYDGGVSVYSIKGKYIYMAFNFLYRLIFELDLTATFSRQILHPSARIRFVLLPIIRQTFAGFRLS